MEDGNAEKIQDRCSWKQKKEIFLGFKRYLETEGIEINGMEKSALKRWYCNEYSIYRYQISPTDKMPSFFSVYQVAYRSKLAYFHNSKLHMGAASKRMKNPSHKDEQAKRHRHDLSGSPSSLSHETSPIENVETTDKQPLRRRRRGRGKVAVDQHLTFKGHMSPVTVESDVGVQTEDWTSIRRSGSNYLCVLCTAKCTSKADTEQHLAGRRHRLAVSMDLLKKKKEQLIEGAHGLSITSDLEGKDGTYFINTAEDKTVMSEITIINNGELDVQLAHCEMMKRIRVFTLRDSKKVTDGTGTVAVIKPGSSYKIHVRTLAKHLGNYHCPLTFHFIVGNGDELVSCHMVRYLHARCKNDVIDDVRPTSQYRRPPRVARYKGGVVDIVPGLKLPSGSSDTLERDRELGKYSIPENFRKMVNRGFTDAPNFTEEDRSQMADIKSVLEADLSMSEYRKRFETLLYFEEIQMEVDIRKYDMEAVTMTVYHANKHLLSLEVPGLSENRPSVLKGDWLYVRYCEPDGKLSKKEYQGYVHEVCLNNVALGFDKKRNIFVEKMKFNVRFVFNRLPVRLQHRSCHLAVELTLNHLLFPGKDMLHKTSGSLPDLKFYNPSLEKNKEQMCAVQHIVAGTSHPAPYIVFGPPGTGKTVTIVEAIKQICKCLPSCHILACTPSNSAADLIAQRLVQHIPKSHIYRLNAMSRSWTAVPDDIKDLCNYDRSTGQYYFPSKNELAQYKVLITTLVTAGRLVSANFPSGHFSHVFIDEAGHAVEPESLIAIAGIVEVNAFLPDGGGQVVIAGDPKQLGPILRSPLAIKYGLDKSLLERYMDSSDLYKPRVTGHQNKLYDSKVITKLLKNYRSHPAILKLPSEMFYDSELVPCADKIARERLCHWEGLEKPGFPILFHGVIGEDMREERSPSFFNPEEVSLVLKYVQDLMNCRKGGIHLKAGDIGVISPYRKQVQKIKQVLKKNKYEKITVGSVEEFQGQERTVIIVSTVRSRPEYLSLDMQFRLGFLRNHKRFNVTVTRAKALLIVIGNPNTLCQDHHWRQLIEYCTCQGAYRGIEFLPEADELEDLVQRLTAVNLIDEGYTFVPELQSEYSEQPWRKDM